MTRKYLFQNGTYHPDFAHAYKEMRPSPPDSGQFILNFEEKGYARIQFTNKNAPIEGQYYGTGGQITFGFDDLDLTHVDRIVIDWEHIGPTNNDQDWSFAGVNRMGQLYKNLHDSLHMIYRSGIRHGRLTGPTVQYTNVRIPRRNEILNVQDHEGRFAFGLGAQIGTSKTHTIEHTVRVWNIWMEGNFSEPSPMDPSPVEPSPVDPSPGDTDADHPTSSLTVSREVPPGPFINQETRGDDVTFECDVRFPTEVPEDAMLFKHGASGIGTWVGLFANGNEGVPAMVGRAGDGSRNPGPGMARFETSNIPLDGEVHNVVVDIRIQGPGRIRLFIDGVLTAEGYAEDDLRENVFSGGSTPAYGWDGDEEIPVVFAKTTREWPGYPESLHSNLRIYGGGQLAQT